jgi:transposase
MPGAENIQLDEQAREELKALAASRTSAVRLWERATIILELAAGRAKQELAKQLGLARQTVRRWEQRFLQRGIAGLNDAPRSGRPPTLGPEKIAQIVHKTIQETPGDSTQWSTRSLAQPMEVSACSVSRIWRKHKLQPHRVRTFKLSNDRLFAEKTADIVTLYLNPPADSIVWSADEQCQLQALRRTQASLPCAPGPCATETGDYIRFLWCFTTGLPALLLATAILHCLLSFFLGLLSPVHAAYNVALAWNAETGVASYRLRSGPSH